MFNIKMYVFPAFALFAGHVFPADLSIQVAGLEQPYGEVSCALFKSDKGFPMQASGPIQRTKANSPQAACQFTDLQPGEYAVSVAHDQNGNGRLDTNLLGIPQEQWGVSNNVRPRLRAPRFAEALFAIAPDEKQVVLNIGVAK